MTGPGRSDTVEVSLGSIEQVAREAWDAQARNIASPPLTFDRWWEQRVQRSLDELLACAGPLKAVR